MNLVERFDIEHPSSSDNGLSAGTDSGRIVRMSPFVLKATSIASLGGILFGYDLGVVSGALPQLKNAFELEESQEEMVVSFLYIGAGIGAVVGGWICDAAGRKKGILLTDLIFVLGAAILYWAQTLPTVLLGRIIVGFAVAVSGIADVSYLHEISPMEWRGAIVSVNEACISLGFLVSYSVGYGISLQNPDDGWRSMFGLSAFIAIIQFSGMCFMPESPVWLKVKGLHEEAKNSMRRITNQGDGFSILNESEEYESDICSNEQSKESGCDIFKSHQPIDNLTQSFRRNEKDTEHSSYELLPMHCSWSGPSIFISNIFGTSFKSEISKYHKQIMIAFFLSTMQQFCGHPNILNFAPEIFSQVGFGSKKAALGSTLLLGVAKFLTTCWVIWKIERIGRRFLLISGLAIIALSLVLLSISFTGYDDSHPMPLVSRYVALVGVFGVAMGYAASFGPLTWLIVSELFPTAVRGRALGVSTVISYLSASIVSYTFLSVQSRFGPSVPFAMYCILTTVSIMFAFVSVPDTGGKTFEEVEDMMKKMWWWRRVNTISEKE